jgi:ABC-type dipeptide/oligopeptide/nickel transport system permease subunit
VSQRFITIIQLIVLIALITISAVSIFHSEESSSLGGSNENVSKIRQGPSRSHPLGTDHNGIDVIFKLSRAMNFNIKLGLTALISFLLIGVGLGVSIGYFKDAFSILGNGKIFLSFKFKTIFGFLVKILASIVSQIFQVIPTILVMIATVIIVQRYVSISASRIYVDMVIIGAFLSPKLGSMIQSKFIQLKHSEYIIAAKATGVNSMSLIFKHILWRQCKGILIMQSVNLVLQIFMFEIFLSYYRLGADNYSLGVMLKTDLAVISTWFLMPSVLSDVDIIQSSATFILIILVYVNLRWVGITSRKVLL